MADCYGYGEEVKPWKNSRLSKSSGSVACSNAHPRELLAQAKEAEETSDLAPQMMRLKAEQYADISARFRNALEKKSKRIEIKY